MRVRSRLRMITVNDCDKVTLTIRIFTRPAGLAVDASGNVFVVDEGNNRFQNSIQMEIL